MYAFFYIKKKHCSIFVNIFIIKGATIECVVIFYFMVMRFVHR